jgi:hypothetical protein
VKHQRYNAVKEYEAKRRRAVIRQRGSRSAMSRQREVSLVGNGANWQITNLHQVAMAMAKWA